MRFREDIEKFCNKLPDASIADVVKAIRADKKCKITLSDGTLKTYIRQIRREAIEVITVEDVEDWVIEEDNYVFNLGGKRKTFSIELIDDIFLFYSRKGHDYTRLQLQQRLGLNPRTFGQIQRKFNLSKECDLISPYTKHTNEPDEVLKIIDDKIEKVLDSGELTTQKYQKAVARKNRKNIEDLKLDQGWREGIISELIAEYPLVKDIEIKRDKNNDIEEIAVVLADTHAGGKAEKTKLSDAWNMEMLAEKLTRVAEVANSYKAAKVHIVILGDLVETVSGVNHPDSWKGIEGGMFGANIIIKAMELLHSHLISKVVNLASIAGTGGNHDRLQASNKLADTGATDLIFYMLKERLADTDVEVLYDPVLVAFKMKKFGIIGVHGDKGLHKRELSYITHKFAVDRNQYQFVFSAHLHSFFCKMNDDQEFARRVTIPAIMSGNGYSDIAIGRASKSGCVVVKENMFGEPDMIVHNL